MRLAVPILLLMMAGACHRSSDASPATAAPPPATKIPMVRRAVSEWPVFTGDHYQLRMPGSPAEGPGETASLGLTSMTMKGIIYTTQDDNAQFGVTTFDFPTVAADIQPESELYVVVRDRLVHELGAPVESDVVASMYGTQGDEIELGRAGTDGGPGDRVSGRFFSAGKRLYFIVVIRSSSALSGTKVREYLDSFHLTG